MKIDFELANKIGLSYITNWLPYGKRQGKEWISKNPTRIDSKPGSFKINTVSGIWKDFATGEGGGDPVSLYAYINGLSQGEAARNILEKYGHVAIDSTPPKKESDEWECVLPIPQNTKPKFTHPINGDATHVFQYEDINGNVLFYILRWDTKDGKDIRPFSYCKQDGKFEWKYKRPKTSLPLFGLPTIKNNRNPIVLVEGELKAVKLRNILKNYNILSWCGGSNNVKNCDFSTLVDREVVIWADNDEPGFQAAEEILEILKPIARPRLANIPAGKQKGWDCHDAIKEGWNESDFMPILNQKINPVSLYPFRALGFDHGNYYFLSARTKQIVSFSASGLTKNSLLSIANMKFWEDNFPSKNGFDVDLAVDSLIGLCENAGPYDPSRIRGRGAWFDEGRTVLHLGDKIISNDIIYNFHEFESKYIYESRPGIPSFSGNANLESIMTLNGIIKNLNWENPMNADLLLGWCILAPICGALEWRPHIWLTGPSGSGKTWVLENIVRKLLGKQVLHALGESSANGLRQENGNDAQPIIIEEAEPKDRKMLENLQSILFMARQASSEGGGVIYKGTQTGKSMRFHLRNMFLFSSIAIATQDAADESRISVLALRPNFGENSRIEFQKLKENVSRLLTPKFCDSFRSRSVKLIPVIRENARVFSEAASNILNSQRLGDQIGALLGGYWTSLSEYPIEYIQAEEYLLKHNLEDQEKTGESKDEDICLYTILQSIVKINGSEMITISELIERANGRGNTSSISPFDADNILRRFGIRIKDKYIYFQNNHPEIKKFLYNTPYNNYNLILKRISGSKTSEKIRILSGQKPVRACGVPMDAIFDGSKD